MAAQVVVAWSGGKDCALALEAIRRDPRYEVVGLLTTLAEAEAADEARGGAAGTSGVPGPHRPRADEARVAMHGVRRTLLLRQAEAIGLPLREVSVPEGASNEVYAERMGVELDRARAAHPSLEGFVFGDLFLEDVRGYRERMLEPTGLRAVFPLWGRDTAALARDLVRRGYRAVLACVDTTLLSGAFAGREFDDALLADLPAGVDPCGENGEFHTFVHAGPIFTGPVPFRRGEVTLGDGRFARCDLLPESRREAV